MACPLGRPLDAPEAHRGFVLKGPGLAPGLAWMGKVGAQVGFTVVVRHAKIWIDPDFRKGEKMTRKTSILTVFLFAALAYGATLATEAFAVSEILYNGTAISTELLILVEGEWLEEDMDAITKSDVLCSGIFGATVAPGGKLFLLLELLMLEGSVLLDENGLSQSELLPGEELGPNDLINCESISGTCEGLVPLTTLNLPWDVDIELMGSGTNEWLAVLLEEFGKAPRFTMDCHTLLGLALDECSWTSSARLENTSEGVILGFFNEESEGFNCTLGEEREGLLEGALVIRQPEGSLSLS